MNVLANQRGISSVFFVAEVWASSQNFSSTECNTFFLETFDTLSLSSTITHEYEWPISNDGESFVRASPLQNGMWIFRKLPTTHDNRIWTILAPRWKYADHLLPLEKQQLPNDVAIIYKIDDCRLDHSKPDDFLSHWRHVVVSKQQEQSSLFRFVG